ncbi:hypothetical protein ACKUVQ_07765 [Mycobacterium seoulense]|uniref:hypothetical protein n=1 Tax=Mycobacterium seoulense TaxID=386911 RepID=UPI003CF5B5C5
MFVVVQFPITDGRIFANQSGRTDRPDWLTPKIPQLLAHRDFVRGFGRLANRREEATPAWIDEAFFAYANRAVKFPELRQHRTDGDGGKWSVHCSFRRLLSDGEAVVRLEIGFHVTTAGWLEGSTLAEPIVSELLGLPAVVPGDVPEKASTKDLILIGPSIARRYAQATTRHGYAPAATLVAAGEPIVVVMLDHYDPLPPLDEAIPAFGTETERHDPLCLAATRTSHGAIETWYLTGPYGQQGRPLRLALLRQHAQEEALDRMLRWITIGAVNYEPQSPEGDRLEAYINDATNVVNRDSYGGVVYGPLRQALDKATSTERRSVLARRRKRLDGMRRQVRLKAERFLSERDARKPTMTIYGGVTMGDSPVFSGVFHGPVAGTVNAGVMQDSFNNFTAQQPNEELKAAVGELYKQVGELVGRLQEESPDEAADVTATLKDLTTQATKDQPNKVTLRRLGGNIVETAKKVAEFAAPVASAVLAVLKLFGIPSL